MVNGTLHGNTIHVASIEKLTSIGLEVGHKAPTFSAISLAVNKISTPSRDRRARFSSSSVRPTGDLRDQNDGREIRIQPEHYQGQEG